MLQTTLPLLLFLFPLAYSPGPGNLFFAAAGARFGLRATWPANAGYHIATWVMTLGIGLGLAQALLAFPAALRAIQIIGAGYVFWLALQFWRAGASEAQGEATDCGFGAGAMLLLLNPKAYVIIALMFSQFLPSGDTAQIAPVLWITSIFTLNNLVAFTLWTVVGDQLARRFRHPDSARRLNRGFAVLLGAVAIYMAVT